ncbi:MAG: hypothetical protein ACRC6V_07795 [Bacteroidales bacterium]
MTQIKEFNNLDLMQTVRNNHLNPLIRRIETQIVPTLETLEAEIHTSFKDVSLDAATKTLKFDKGPGGYKEINLSSIMPEFPGIGVQNIQGSGPSAGIKLVQFPDATITVLPSGEAVTVGFAWEDIFNHNQKWTEAIVKGALSEMKTITFTGDPLAVKATGTNVTVKIPEVKPLMVSIPDGSPAITTPVAVGSVEITGETGGCVIDPQGKLTLNLSAGGGGGITNQNFKGFYDSLGDIQAHVKDPIDGKSFAFAKNLATGGKYYTPYFYVNNAWQELKQDPALTYNASSVSQGVFSIKPNPGITIDPSGQLDLGGLSTPQLPQYFVGFFDSLEQLKAEVPKPTPKQTFAFVKGGGRGWLTYRADMQGSASKWDIVAPLGSFTFVDDDTQSFTQVFGIKKSDAWEVDGRGILNMKGGGGTGPGGALSVSISGSDSQVETHDVTGISFNKGKSFAEFTGANKDHVLLDHPQRVINYNSTWESNHNTRDYEGNIFYDETARAWMGWGIPKVPGAVDNKWTRIAHPHMSDEVKDLTRRVPAKAASVTPGLIGDNPMWDHIGTTFLEINSTGLPEEIRSTCGGYITTVVQDKDTAGVTIPQYRMQTCLADRDEGGTWIRRLLATGSGGSAISWSPWVKSSFGRNEIVRHERDPNAHKDVFKFYAVHSITGKVANIQQQTLDGQAGALRADGNFDVLADNYGHIKLQQDHGTVPYDHTFTAEGVIELSGYTVNEAPIGRWDIKLKVLKVGETVKRDLAKFYYTHTDKDKHYPPMKFKVPATELKQGDELYMFVTFDNPTGLLNKNPDMYIVPVRSYIAYQDAGTSAGTLIGANYRKLLGKVDVTGDFGVKVHLRDPSVASSSIRVYGTRLQGTPVDMNPIP